MKYNKIALIGMMGSGKSSISKLLAQKLSFKALELDELFEKQENISIKEFFDEFGETEFRKIESEILLNSLKKDNAILSTGGGVVLKEENRILLFNDNVLTIYLKTAPHTIFERIKADNSRPLLMVENPKKEIEKIIENREKYYNLAKITIETDNKTKEEIAEEILKWIK